MWMRGRADTGVGFPEGDSLTVIVVGASGDLAKKKTYPALYELHLAGLLPPGTIITGYARSKLSNEKLRVRWGARPSAHARTLRVRAPELGGGGEGGLLHPVLALEAVMQLPGALRDGGRNAARVMRRTLHARADRQACLARLDTVTATRSLRSLPERFSAVGLRCVRGPRSRARRGDGWSGGGQPSTHTFLLTCMHAHTHTPCGCIHLHPSPPPPPPTHAHTHGHPQETLLGFLSAGTPEEKLAFVERCTYYDGGYDSAAGFGAMAAALAPLEAAASSSGHSNRLYYLATPPSVFLDAAASIKAAGLATSGWCVFGCWCAYAYTYACATGCSCDCV